MTTRKIISIVNRNGRVGKTTLALGIADAFVSEHRTPVSIVDLDPQSTASQALLPAGELEARVRSGRNLHGLLLARLSGEDPDLQVHRCDRLRVIKDRGDAALRLFPNSQRLWDLEDRELRFDGGVRLSNAIRRVLRQEADEGRIVIVDCPPGQPLSALAAIQGSDLVLCPLTPDRLTLWSKELLTGYLKDYAPRIRRRFVVTRAAGRGREAARVLESLAQDLEMLPVSAPRPRSTPAIARLTEARRIAGRLAVGGERPLRKIYGSQGARELALIVHAIRRELDPPG